jgi:hypothetical protein
MISCVWARVGSAVFIDMVIQAVGKKARGFKKWKHNYNTLNNNHRSVCAIAPGKSKCTDANITHILLFYEQNRLKDLFLPRG